MSDTDQTTLGRGIAAVAAPHAGQSGFHPLGNGLDAFVARLAFAEAAERSLDVQYYLFHDDATGRLLAERLLRAADRGVRVRVLLDDMDMGGRDAALAAISQHPNIEIRLFNPFPSRSMRYLNFLSHFGTVTRRMHNKSFTIDNQVTIVGGRNIGDEYFEAAAGTNFGDMDVLALGPIVREVSAAFDRYWNSDLAFPVEAFGTSADPQLVEHGRQRLKAETQALEHSAYAERLRASNLARDLAANELPLYWATARLLYDLPEKVRTDPGDRSTHLGPELRDLVQAAQSELFAISPYFVPGESGTALLLSLVQRGVRVTVLTNSLAATDVPAVHAGYARYRKALVAGGVELYEMRPTHSAAADDRERRRLGESQASLHAKTMVFDADSVLVGSMNLDPRSSLLNTEMGILIDSPEMARAVAAWRDQTLPEQAWRIELESVAAPIGAGQQQRLVWVETAQGRELQRHQREPQASTWARLQAFLLALLPIEQQL